MDNSKYYSFDNIVCPVCGNSKFMIGRVPPDNDPQGTIYWCTTGRKNHATNFCSGVLAYCNKCEKVYTSKNFGLHNNVYECKTCGSVQWEYTDYMNFENRAMQILKSIGVNKEW